MSGTTDYRQKFLEFLDSETQAEPLGYFGCRAAPISEVPFLSRGMPWGVVLVYSDYLVFLTNESGTLGANIVLKGIARTVGGIVVDGATHAVSEVGGIALKVFEKVRGYIGKHEDFIKAIGNHNSVFLSLNEIVRVEPGRTMRQGCFIKVFTHERAVLLHQDVGAEGLRGSFAMFQNKWQTDVTEFLVDRARKNVALLQHTS